MRGMVQLYGFNTSSKNNGLLIAKNVHKFMEYCRMINSRYDRGTNTQRMDVNAITAGVMSTPPCIPRDSDSQQECSTRSTGNIPVRRLLNFFWYTTWVSSHPVKVRKL